jgi:hypothetical protein
MSHIWLCIDLILHKKIAHATAMHYEEVYYSVTKVS